MDADQNPGEDSYLALNRMLERANAISNTTQLDGLLVQTLALSMEIAHAQAGVFYLLGDNSYLIPRASMGLASGKLAPVTDLDGENFLPCQCLLTGRPIERDLWGANLTELVDLNMLRGLTLRNTLVLPVPRQVYPVGVLQLFNLDTRKKDLLQILCDRMATEIQKLVLLQVSEERTHRLQSMVGFLGRIDSSIDSSLDPQQILETIIEDASKVLNAEVCSLFLAEEGSNDLTLRISSREDHLRGEPLRVPRGQGIIGYVVQTGETVLVKDTQRDLRHYNGLDMATDFHTRSLVAVPLIRRSIHLPNGRMISSPGIIGGIEAVNKINGDFDAVDLSLLESFANQAATVLQISNMYDEANELFLDAIRALTAAIDAKDTYTKGHSQRVSDIAVLIAIELGLDSNEIHHVRIGSMLHDVGKIGIPDSILGKKGSLTHEEFERMKEHPLIGERMLRRVRTLRSELAAVSEHHERLDGTGYPRGLQGEEISQIGRIVAVADAFDAMTSDRPYRKAMSFEEALRRLVSKAVIKFDARIIEALMNVYQNKTLQTLFEQVRAEVVTPESVFWVQEE